MRRLSSLAVFLLCVFLLNACTDSDYLMQCAKGQWLLMSQARPIDDILAEKTEPQNVREQLAKVVRIRAFAVSSLDLPDTGSYRKYSDLKRPYAVWNLVVAPEFSLKLKQWCFPIAGCVTYRGYFEEASARALGDDFSAQGYDVDVYGVQAYSTLNWFDDPVLNTFLNNDDMRLAALLFHEMAHQVIYVKNDTAFNESFAKTVEIEGLRRWLQVSGSQELWEIYLQREDRSAEFHQLLADVRTRLGRVYESKLDNDLKRSAKKEILQQAFVEYEELKKHWGGYVGYDPWMQRGLNNARLSSMATYYDLIPAFQNLLVYVDSDLQKFYAEVKVLGSLPKDERLAKLKSFSPHLTAALNESPDGKTEIIKEHSPL